MTALLAPHTPSISTPAWAYATRTGPSLWRVTDSAKRPLGHLRAEHGDDGWVYRAERWDSRNRDFRVLGSFWSPADAFDCLRYQG